jgi:hypothetical protein
MEAKHATETLIEQMILATYGDQGSPREKHALRESLRALVRLAKAEQMLDMRIDARRLTAVPRDIVRTDDNK